MVRPYEEALEAVKMLAEQGKRVWIDPERVNYAFFHAVPKDRYGDIFALPIRTRSCRQKAVEAFPAFLQLRAGYQHNCVGKLCGRGVLLACTDRELCQIHTLLEQGSVETVTDSFV